MDVYQARVWATPYDDGSFSRLVGRFRSSQAYPDAERVLWEFELEDDAIIFAIRFGGISKGPVDVSKWRLGVPYPSDP